MKKTLTILFTLLLALTLVACGDTDNSRAGVAYRMAFGEAKNLNRITSQEAVDSDVTDYLVGQYYDTDYDWVTAIEKGIASERGDFSKIRKDVNDNKPYSIDDLGYTRVLSDASLFPLAITKDSRATKEDGTLDKDASKKLLDNHWEITLRDDLQFSDGTKIDTETVKYSLMQYLNPNQLAVRGNHIYDKQYLNLVNAREYYFQNTDVIVDEPVLDAEGEPVLDNDGNPVTEEVNKGKPEPVSFDEVGFEIIDEYTFRLKANAEDSQWGIMSSLTVFSLVHPAKYEAGYNAERTTTTYGGLDNLPVSYGPYVLTNWEQDQKFTFERNEKYHNADKYPIKYIDGPIITAQGTIIEEFKAGNLDVAGVSGVYYPDFVDNPGLYTTPSNSFFRLDISLDRTRGGTQSGDHESKILKQPDFRKALLLGIDREGLSSGPSAPAEPLVGYVSNIHRTKEEAASYYNATSQHLDLVEELGMSENGGYNPTEAKALFAAAYAQAVLDGDIVEGAKAKVEYGYYDVESNQNLAKWLKAHFEELFGTEKFEWVNKGRGSDDHKDHRDSGDFDLMFGGLSGGNYMTVILFDMVYGSGGFYDGKGFDIRGTTVKPVEVFNLFDIVSAIPVEERTDEDIAFLEGLDDKGVFEGTFLELSNWYDATARFNAEYDGRDEDLANIVQSLERVMFELIPTVSLFSSVSAAVYSEHVDIFAPAWSENMGWGGMQYRNIVK